MSTAQNSGAAPVAAATATSNASAASSATTTSASSTASAAGAGAGKTAEAGAAAPVAAPVVAKKTVARTTFVDFAKWDIGALKRYKRHYKLRTAPNATKADLVDAVTTHFQSMPVEEYEIISFFVFAIQNKDKYALLT
ncbi:uncharacterized protein AMSG_09381 [Thecamonas trahens ATCC 50062]|uniref:Histone deacetylase complex subunit SAP30 Sin3 binding domain-containing protein n=1 Tax=Thecamonas trahens ATCC 50062 TaxID=461836 RepID=A0A0L0DLH0_THETB|nr:hypothetical protein AMSG_09381 [Thecamonas trahens ATCC 50062]KNC53080.1 hypothetical protein AMSG_09381 [Thecamonas trahens ATCC 50062]|eukprot:XP_013754753.1 hypothetical protein AMSG_09381 [Thecamonas trahens ATCC 50062]